MINEIEKHLVPFKKGFTLAEVLITLGIIGVVAAMTIPTLVQNYNKRTWDTGAAVFERKLEEALKTMNTQQTLAGHTTTESFIEELSKHFKVSKICKNHELQSCFSEKVFWGNDAKEIDMTNIKKAKDFGQNNWHTNIVGAQFANGTTALIAYNDHDCFQDPYSNQVVTKNCLAILYDTSGYKNPNTSLKDLRNVNVHRLGNEVGCAFELNGKCWSAGFTSSPLTYAECLEYADELGIPCYNWAANGGTDENYWAGAVKYCKDLGGRLPSSSEIESLADELYNWSMLSGASAGAEGMWISEDSVTCWDETKAASYGLSIGADEAALIANNTFWSADAVSGDSNGAGANAWHYEMINYAYVKMPLPNYGGASGARCILD